MNFKIEIPILEFEIAGIRRQNANFFKFCAGYFYYHFFADLCGNINN